MKRSQLARGTTPLKRTAMRRRPPASKCRHCRKATSDALRLHQECVEPWYEANRERLAKAKERALKRQHKAQRAADKARAQKLESIADLIKLADRAFAAWVRARDRLAGHPCISSGRPLDWTGNQVDAGHYRSRGAASHLRYHPDNCHAQSKGDNLWKSGNVVEYRIRLIRRIGLERVQALEADNHVHHWTKDELRGIAATYRAKTREIEKATA